MDWRATILLNFTLVTNGCPSSRLLSVPGMRIVVLGTNRVWGSEFRVWPTLGVAVALQALTITLTLNPPLFRRTCAPRGRGRPRPGVWTFAGASRHCSWTIWRFRPRRFEPWMGSRQCWSGGLERRI